MTHFTPILQPTLKNILLFIGILLLVYQLARLVSKTVNGDSNPSDEVISKILGLIVLALISLSLIYGILAAPLNNDGSSRSLWQMAHEAITNPFPSDALNGQESNTVLVYYRPDCPDCTKYQQELQNAVYGYDVKWLNTNAGRTKPYLKQHRIEWVPTIVVVYEDLNRFVTIPIYADEATGKIDTDELNIALKQLYKEKP